MRYILIVFLLPVTVWSAEITVEKFDQSKLEFLLRRVPSALFETTQVEDYTRKIYLFPGHGPLKISCSADYFNSHIPTYKTCHVSVDEGSSLGISSSKKNDEYRIIFSSAKTVRELKEATSSRAFNSHEQFSGRSFDGGSRKLFRYSFTCLETTCQLSLATK